ncbi:MAG: magnesium transporter [Planctomycetota bacterium]|nr:MAG: magnesium transporter [Planctomycetota bacterium]
MSDRLEVLRELMAAELSPASSQIAISQALEESHPSDLAFALSELDPEVASRYFSLLNNERAAEVLAELEEDTQRELISSLPVRRVANLLDELQPDDAADIYQQLPSSLRSGVLEGVEEKRAQQIRLLGAYEEESAGGIMTPQFVAVTAKETVASTLEAIRAINDLETDRVYIVDSDGRLLGVTSIQELLHQEQRRTPISTWMDSSVVSVHEDDDQEEVLRIASMYGLTTVPVVDDDERLVGIVTADDLDFVAEAEASEDMYRMAGTLAKNPTRASVPSRIFARLPMLLFTVVVGLSISWIVTALTPSDNGAPRNHPLRYLPIIIALAGNVAAVANAIVVRGLATGELEHGRLTGAFLGEFAVACGVGVIASVLTWLGITTLEADAIVLANSVSASLFLGTLVSASAGFATPAVFDRMGLDAALTGPFVIAMNDLAGTAVFVAVCSFALST